MATRTQIKANRDNAKKSTGPRTKEGKSRVAKNALKHGLLARDTVLPGEDPADFDSQLIALEADIGPANSLEFELVRQIADAQWRMRRLTRLETGFISAAVDDTRRHAEKHCPDTLRPGYDGETLLLGSAMLERTQAFVHLARYDGHLSRRFFRAVKQLADLRRDERKARETSAGSYTPTDPYRGPYVPAQAPPPIETPSPTAGRIGFRASGESVPPAGLSKMDGNSCAREGAGPLADVGGSRRQRASSHRRRGCAKRVGKSLVAHASRRAVSPFVATSSPRNRPSTDPSACRPNPHQLQTTKQTQFRRTPMKSTPYKPIARISAGPRRLDFPHAARARQIRGRLIKSRRRLTGSRYLSGTSGFPEERSFLTRVF